MATNAQRAKEKALKIQQENDPDYVAPKKEKDTAKLVEAAIKTIAKDGCTFTRMKDKSKELRPVLPTGIFGVDHAIIGSGGFPRGRIVELFGQACLDGNTFIQYHVRTPEGKTQNCKGGTIERLYQRFSGNIPRGKGVYPRKQTVNSFYTCSSMTEDRRIIQNRITGVWQAGVKPCLTITTEGGNVITCTADHKFYTGSGWTPAGDLAVGGKLYRHNNSRWHPEVPAVSRKYEVFVKHHPHAPSKAVTDMVWPGHGTYIYKRLPKSRAVYEAHMNGLTYKQYIKRLNQGDLTVLQFISPDLHVHHIDVNHKNNSIENLELLDPVAHGKVHGPRFSELTRPVAVEDKIISITEVGERMTYDISMEDPHNNFVADGLVVHNSAGKGTLLSQLIANTQRLNPKDEIAYIDAECAFDHAYAAKLGVDTDNLLIAEPEYGEQALQACLDVVTTGGIKLAIIDSVASLVPRAELEGEISDAHMGLQASMIGKALRKMTGITSKTGTCIVFVNQLRATMNTGFGAKNDTPGGKALKFFSSLRLAVDRLSQYKERGEEVGSITKIQAKKNKTFRPFLSMDLNLMFDERGQQPGFDSHMSLVDLALANAIWIQDGSKYSLPSTSEFITGKANLRDALRDNKELRLITERATLEAMGKSEPYIKRALRG